jgi:flavin reductase (DIM6/NTAB) family NADH-FMN oxidoreductase RutF
MISIDPTKISVKDLHGQLLSAVSPRPIGFASTIDQDGNPNLSPFSFFNVFSANPPILIFSPARRVRDNTTKDTLKNCHETRQVVINIVDFAMVEQMSLSSCEFGSDVNEFVKAGFTMGSSEKVKPFRVMEAPVQLECEIKEIKALGEDGGAGNLIICELVHMHIQERICGSDGKIDPAKLDVVARMGGNFYSRALEGVFEIPKPTSVVGIGMDNLPELIKNTKDLTSNQKARLAGIAEIPSSEDVDKFLIKSPEFRTEQWEKKIKFAETFLKEFKIKEAWITLIQ